MLFVAYLILFIDSPNVSTDLDVQSELRYLAIWQRCLAHITILPF